MKAFLKPGLVAFLVSLTIADLTRHSPIGEPKIKRGFLTCRETYGGGSTTCGSSSSHYCYDPTLGESCCLLDDGYCKLGQFCAPEAGFCCYNGEDPATCAARLSLTLPLSFSTATATATSSMTDISIPTDLAIVSASLVPITSTIEVVAGNQAVSSTIPILAPAFGGLRAQVSTSTRAMTPDFTAMINMSAPSATSIAGLGAGGLQFTGTARRVGLWTAFAGILGFAALAGLLL